IKLLISLFQIEPSIKPDQHVFRGETVTIRCDIDGEGVTSWQYSWYKDSSVSVFSELQEHTFSPVTESDAGKYSCYGAERGGSRSSQNSDAFRLTVSERPKAKVSIKPAQHVFRGDTVTLRCDIDGEGVTSWQYSWYKDDSSYSTSELQEHTFRSVTESDAGKYFCYGAERGGSRSSQDSDAVTLTVSVLPKPTVTVEPQSSLFTGDSVTLRCEVDRSWDEWEFIWIKDMNTESTEAVNKTIDSVKVSDGGEYRCRARRGGHYTDYSEPVTVTIYERPKAKVTIKPDQRVFRGETVTLRCDIDGEGVTGWQYSWYKDSSANAFSDQQEHTFRSVTESDAGKYSCYGAERVGSCRSQHSDEVTLTFIYTWYVKNNLKTSCFYNVTMVFIFFDYLQSTYVSSISVVGVILESPVHPVTEGDTLTLRCLHQNTSSVLRADFYKDESLIQNQLSSQTQHCFVYSRYRGNHGFCRSKSTSCCQRMNVHFQSAHLQQHVFPFRNLSCVEHFGNAFSETML
uniref:Ig-like domain-containing protein n=1 Tax=Sinocyclocheilus rhinocerous TaxID=307959 RepID=A0A673MJ06_9TELE